jgi:hypothetical protein
MGQVCDFYYPGFDVRLSDSNRTEKIHLAALKEVYPTHMRESYSNA